MRTIARQRLSQALLLLLAVSANGCPRSRPAPTPLDASRLSLTDLGEQSLDLGEQLEEQELFAGALEAYRRAAWALEYDQTLTGRTPLLLDEAREGVRRLEKHSAEPPTVVEPIPGL